MTRPMILLSMSLLAAVVRADTIRLVDNMEDPGLYQPGQPELGHKWTGEVALETADYKEGRGCLRFRLHSAKTGEESYPQYARAFDPETTDWSAFGHLRYWVKVTSDDPRVTQKNMCVVVYNGDSPLQQFTVHTVPVGEWVQLTDTIIDYNRDRVRGIIIYMYETDPALRDSYTWLVDGLELVGLDPAMRAFDGFGVVPARQPAREPVHELKTSEGLTLRLDSTGRVAGLRQGDTTLSSTSRRLNVLTGFLIRDWREGETLIPVEGLVERRGDQLVETASLLHGLRLEARFAADGERLRCDVKVRDEAREGRPLTLYFAVPVERGSWRWWDDIAHSRLARGRGEFFNNPSLLQKPRVSPYPFSCISRDDAALSLAVPLEPARLQRTTYNPELGLLYIAWDFYLTPLTAKQDRTAEFTFYLYPCDPAWGFRSAAERYYRYFPEYFVKRVPKEGGWVCWGTLKDNDKLGDLGFAYHWGPDTRGGSKSIAESMATDNSLGILTFPYVEFTNMHLSMEGYEEAGPREIMERVRLLADPDQAIPPISYDFPYNAEYFGPDRDGVLREVFQAYLKSLIYDSNGNPYGRADKQEFGILAAKYIPFNADPEIPGGAGEFFLRKQIPLMEKAATEGGAVMDGFGWDNFYVGGGALDYRPEHFAYADAPLIFDGTLKPAIVKDMATYELQREVVRYLRDKGRYLIANQGNISPVPATLPLLDIFGYEWNIQNTNTYARTMAFRKPVCSLPCAPAHYEEPYVNLHLLYGCWPGGYYNTTADDYVGLLRRYVPIIRRLTEAGWEPITRARCADERVQVERFGGGEQPLLLTVRNHSSEPTVAEVRLDPELLRPTEGLTATELLTGDAVPVASEAGSVVLRVPVPATWTVAVAVGRRAPATP